MDPNASNQGNVPPPDFDPGQTIVVPVQTGYNPPPYQSAQNPSPHPPAQSMLRNDRDRTMLAILLIGGGVLFLFAQLGVIPSFGGLDFGDFVLLLIGGAFMYAYFNTKADYRVGFLIPGAILLGLGVGKLIGDLSFVNSFVDDIMPLTLGLGFCLIWLLERKHWWALIPGGILTLIGISSGAIGNFWPLALIVIGVYLLYDQSRHRTAH